MKYILVPISTVGCGKSTTFRILTSLHPEWIHVENDSCSSKNNFYRKLTDALQATDVVLLDRNNQLLKQRLEIFDRLATPDVRLVALEFVVALTPKNELWDFTYERIKKRGDNHQQIMSLNVGMTKMIVSRFVKEFEPYNSANQGDSRYIPLQMTLGEHLSLENARRILCFLHREDPAIVKEVPNDELIWEFYIQALEYQVPESEKSGKNERRSEGARGRGKSRGGTSSRGARGNKHRNPHRVNQREAEREVQEDRREPFEIGTGLDTKIGLDTKTGASAK